MGGRQAALSEVFSILHFLKIRTEMCFLDRFGGRLQIDSTPGWNQNTSNAVAVDHC